MALIRCPECGREISDQADACPGCGYPIRKKSEGREPGPTGEQIADTLSKGVRKAEDYINNKENLDRLERHTKIIPRIGSYLSDLICLISMTRDFIKKEYRQVPKKTIAAVVIALIYVISPVDLIPHRVPIIHFVDDLAVVVFLLKFIHQDLENYRAFRRR